MEILKDQIEVTWLTINGKRYGRLNMPMKELCTRLKQGGAFIGLKLSIMNIDAPMCFLLSQQDIDDYNDFEKKDSNIQTPPDWPSNRDFVWEVNEVYINAYYFDYAFFGEDGKVGLKDTCGNIVVPPLFDSAEGIDCIYFKDNMVVVGKDGKLWLTPRDGSGRIVNPNRGYDIVKTDWWNGYVMRAGKQGLVDLHNGCELIPSDMDWLRPSMRDFVFSRDGKIGYFHCFPWEDRVYIEPEYDAIDLSTQQFMKNGEWGWVLSDGTFTTEPLKEGESPVLIEENAKCYIDCSPVEENNHITHDELNHSITFLQGLEAIKEIETPLQYTLNRCLDNQRNLTLQFALQDGSRLVDIRFNCLGESPTMELEWVAEELADQWRDLLMSEKIQYSLNVIISAGQKRPTLTLHRQFEVAQLNMLSKFLTYYLIEFRQIAKENIKAFTIANYCL